MSDYFWGESNFDDPSILFDQGMIIMEVNWLWRKYNRHVSNMISYSSFKKCRSLEMIKENKKKSTLYDLAYEYNKASKMPGNESKIHEIKTKLVRVQSQLKKELDEVQLEIKDVKKMYRMVEREHIIERYKVEKIFIIQEDFEKERKKRVKKNQKKKNIKQEIEILREQEKTNKKIARVKELKEELDKNI